MIDMTPTTGDDVRINDPEHPHHGATGVLEGAEQSIYVAGKRMLMIDFHEKHQGRRGCYATIDQINKQ